MLEQCRDGCGAALALGGDHQRPNIIRARGLKLLLQMWPLSPPDVGIIDYYTGQSPAVYKLPLLQAHAKRDQITL